MLSKSCQLLTNKNLFYKIQTLLLDLPVSLSFLITNISISTVGQNEEIFHLRVNKALKIYIFIIPTSNSTAMVLKYTDYSSRGGYKLHDWYSSIIRATGYSWLVIISKLDRHNYNQLESNLFMSAFPGYLVAGNLDNGQTQAVRERLYSVYIMQSESIKTKVGLCQSCINAKQLSSIH